MKKIKSILLIFSLSIFSLVVNADNIENYTTAESVIAYAETMQQTDQEELKNIINNLSTQEKRKLMAYCVAEVKHAQEIGEDVPMPVIYVLAIILPPLAVGLYTDWDTPTVWNLLFTILGWVPGIVHAFIVITR